MTTTPRKEGGPAAINPADWSRGTREKTMKCGKKREKEKACQIMKSMTDPMHKRSLIIMYADVNKYR